MFYNILLMAGRGNRFKVAGYSKPKALLKYKKNQCFSHLWNNFLIVINGYLLLIKKYT